MIEQFFFPFYFLVLFSSSSIFSSILERVEYGTKVGARQGLVIGVSDEIQQELRLDRHIPSDRLGNKLVGMRYVLVE